MAGFSVSWEVCWNPVPDDSPVSFQAFALAFRSAYFFIINPILDLNYCRILSKEIGCISAYPIQETLKVYIRVVLWLLILVQLFATL